MANVTQWLTWPWYDL